MADSVAGVGVIVVCVVVPPWDVVFGAVFDDFISCCTQHGPDECRLACICCDSCLWMDSCESPVAGSSQEAMYNGFCVIVCVVGGCDCCALCFVCDFDEAVLPEDPGGGFYGELLCGCESLYVYRAGVDIEV